MSLNGYSWVEARVADGRDPSGTCPTNPWWNDIPGQRCVWLANQLSRQYNIPLDVLMQKDVGELEYIYGLGNATNTLSNAAILPTLFYQNPGVAWEALQQFVSGCNIGSTVALGGGIPALGVSGNAAMIVVALGLGSIGLILSASSIAGLVNQSQVYNFSGQIHEYRLNGFESKVGTLAEHLAKLLGRDVAGYGPSGPNPYGDPNGGWCQTIRRVIQEIDDARYSERQLSRDLEEAGFAGAKWSEIVTAAREVIERGLCDDHWGDFGGGSLAAS
jgi:hypothetical protein